MTPSALAYSNAYSMDHFSQSFSDFTSGILASHNAFPWLPMSLEWGDINGADNTGSWWPPPRISTWAGWPRSRT